MGNSVTAPVLKVTIPIKPADLPANLVPPEPAPTGNPVLNVQLAGTNVAVPVHLSGKNARKTLKLLAQHGADVSMVINGVLKPGVGHGSWLIAEASFQTFVKPQPSETAPGNQVAGTQAPAAGAVSKP